MKRIYTLLALLACSLANADITQLEFGSAGDNFHIVFKGANTVPGAFVTEAPPTIVLDFKHVRSTLKSKHFTVNQRGVYSIDVLDNGDRTRAVVNLSERKDYEVMQNGGDIVLRVKGGGSKQLKQSALKNKPNAPKASTRLNLGFAKTDAGNGAVTFNLPTANTVVDVRAEGQHIIADLPGYRPTKGELRRYDVRDYSVLVKAIDVRRNSGGTRIDLNMGKDAYEFITYQTGSAYTIEVISPHEDAKDLAKEALGFGSDKAYKGQPLSLNFQDIEVRSVIQIIAEFTKTNIVVSDSVTGNITLRLDNVPWDQALDIIMKTKGLDKRESNGVLYIAPGEELTKSETAILQGLQDKRRLTPSRSEMIQVKYAKAADLATIIENSRKVTTTDKDSTIDEGVLSPKGKVTVDNRTNTLIVSDIPEKIAAVRRLVDELDIPVRQVLIDSRLVLTQDNFSRDLGVRFGATFVGNVGNTLITGTGRGEGASSMATGAIDNAASTGGRFSPIGVPPLTQRLGVDLAVGRGGSQYGIAILASDLLIDMELSALQTEGQVEIISSPRVVTTDGAVAEIASGQKVPYITRDKDGNPKIEFENAFLSLNVTPRIAPNNMVDMELDVKKDSIGDLVISGGEASHAIDSNHAKTNVLVDNGETLVLGGIYQERRVDSEDKIPLLGDLPAVGNLFKNRKRELTKSELLIFVTPRIIDKMLVEQDKFTNIRN